MRGEDVPRAPVALSAQSGAGPMQQGGAPRSLLVDIPFQRSGVLTCSVKNLEDRGCLSSNVHPEESQSLLPFWVGGLELAQG